MNNQNTVARVFRVVAFVMWVGGFIVGINMGFSKIGILNTDDAGSFNFLITVVMWFVFFVFGMLLYGFGEIIQKLSDINFNMMQKGDDTVRKMDQFFQALQVGQASEMVPREPQKPMKNEILTKTAVTPEVTEENAISDNQDRIVKRSEAMIEDGYLLCPYCNKVQKVTRKDCFHCGAKFVD